MIRYGSVCSGIEAVSVAWRGLDFAPQWFAEIAPFPSAVLKARFPEVPNRGDFTQIRDGAIDLLVGGTPCQSFSVAGLRGGLADDRGNLALEFVRLAQRTRPRWVLWENVPGVLSIDGGRAFGSILGGLAELGYGFAYRILDAQFFGVPQRRRRVFVVGYLGDWRRAAAVLFERASLSWDPPPRRETGARVAAAVGAQSAGGRGWRTGADAHALTTRGGAAGRGTPLVAFNSKDHGQDAGELAPTLRGRSNAGGRPNGGAQAAIAFANTGGATALGLSKPGVPPITTRNGDPGNVALPHGVRRLTPRECERLQGFPDGYTLIEYNGKPAKDGPRYEAMGNSMAVLVLRWIGRRIQLIDGMS